MANRADQREAILAALNGVILRPLATAAEELFAVLGYRSDRHLPISTTQQFREQLDPNGRLSDRECEALAQLSSLHLLFQLSDAELDVHTDMFDDIGPVHATKIESYLFFAVEMPPGPYSRTALATIVRAINKPLPMPALVLFRHGVHISLGIIHRRMHKRYQERDVLEKVILIKDISCATPHRAHIEILYDLSLQELRRQFGITNFVTLHRAWQRTLNASTLNRRFFQELSNWYYWAVGSVEFPQDAPKDAEGSHSVSVIRLLTRLIFCWFIKEKGLVPDSLFSLKEVKSFLRDGFDADGLESTYYKAVLQNLFFATLNTEMDQRDWARDGQNMMAHSLYRYRELFRRPDQALTCFAGIPFLNGGLFECLDKDRGESATPRYVRVDGFSRRSDTCAARVNPCTDSSV